MSQYSNTIGSTKITCQNCGHEESYIKILTETNTEFGECKKCGKMTYVKPNDNARENRSVVKCPYCNSTNTRKISSVSKAGSFALFGIFAIGKSTKQWHCNDCKSDF